MATIKIRWTGDTQPTKVVLSDPTGTYGVRRRDTNAVVVEPGTLLVSLGNDEYGYVFEEPSQGLGYEYYLQFYIDTTLVFTLRRFIAGIRAFIPALESIESHALVYATLLRELNLASDRANWNSNDPTSKPDWIVDVGELQDSPMETLTIYDSGAVQNGIIQTPDGPVAVEHGDIQIRSRSKDYLTGRRKLVQLKDTLIAVRNRLISVPTVPNADAVLHKIAAASVLSGVAYIGPDSKGRKQFTVNLRTSVSRVKV